MRYMGRKTRKKAMFILAPLLAVLFVCAFFTSLVVFLSLTYTAANNFLNVTHIYARELVYAAKTRIEDMVESLKR